MGSLQQVVACKAMAAAWKPSQLPNSTSALQTMSARGLSTDTRALAQCGWASALCRRQHLRLQQAGVLAAPARPFTLQQSDFKDKALSASAQAMPSLLVPCFPRPCNRPMLFSGLCPVHNSQPDHEAMEALKRFKAMTRAMSEHWRAPNAHDRAVDRRHAPRGLGGGKPLQLKVCTVVVQP